MRPAELRSVAGQVDRPEHRYAVEVQADVGRRPRQPEHAPTTAASAILILSPATWPICHVPPPRRHHTVSPSASRHADRRDRVRRPCVELRLVDDLRPEDGGAEHDREHGRHCARPRRRSRRAGRGRTRDRDERGREVEEEERPARPAFDSAARDVVELVPREARVGDEDLDGRDRRRSPQTTASSALPRSGRAPVARACVDLRLGRRLAERREAASEPDDQRRRDRQRHGELGPPAARRRSRPAHRRRFG